MPIVLPQLPYELDALEPHMSRVTMEFHYGRHHKKYVDLANQLITGTELEHLPLAEMVQRATGQAFNQIAQAWNHGFFWQCLTPEPQEPDPELSRALERSFGDLETFQQHFAQGAARLFGSGWAWLVMNDDGTLEVTTTRNGDTPLTEGRLPLLTCDLWEHAYYIDYRNDRARYVQHFWPLVNWEFVLENLSTAAPTARRPARRIEPRPHTR